jgi:hypothetical protein
MLMIRTINIASTGLTTPIKAADEAKDKTTIYTEAVEGKYTKKINDIKETKEQNFYRRDVISATNQAVNLLSILLKSKRRHIKSSVNIHYIY